jgi:hypothetical protein
VDRAKEFWQPFNNNEKLRNWLRKLQPKFF